MAIKNWIITVSFGALWAFLCQGAHSSSQELAQSVRDTIATTSPEEWPETCVELRAQLHDLVPIPQALALERKETESQGMRVISWNGIRIPVPYSSIQTVVLIPGGLAGLMASAEGVVLSSVDLGDHFDHFDGVEGFDGYVEKRHALIGWLHEGLALQQRDVLCKQDSMPSDLVSLVHSLVARLLVSVSEETVLMRLSEPEAVLLVGSRQADGSGARIRYFFQDQESKNPTLHTLLYSYEEPAAVIQSMQGLASAISNSGLTDNTRLSDLIRAILELKYSRAESIAEAIGLPVQIGLE